MAFALFSRALLPVLAFLILPLHLLSLGFRIRRGSIGGRLGMFRSAVSLILIPILFSAIFTLSNTERSLKKDSFISELEELKLKIAGLESILEDSTENLNSKILHLEEKDKIVVELGHKIEYLQGSLHNIKVQKSQGGSSYSEERISSIKEEVQLLWDESRKNNFNLHILESKAYDAGKRLESVTSQVEKMEDIVTEQWIQIQQLEQAFQVTKMRTSKAHRKTKSTKCAVLKFIKNFHRHHLAKVFSFLKGILSGVQRCHHELQGSIKQAMEGNEFTATLANKEFVFLLASVMITLPFMSAWILYSSFSS